MKCPKCHRAHYCGCGSCKPRKGMDDRRSFKFVNGDFIKCAYCRKVLFADVWEQYEYNQMK